MMIAVLLLVNILVNILSCRGLRTDMNREYFYHSKDLFCAQLQCTENIREDTQISALVNMSVYRISEPEEKILVATISEEDSKPRDFKRVGTRVEGKISKTFSELNIFFSNHSDCNRGIFVCDIHYVNTTGSIDRIGKQTENLERKSRDTFLMMNLKAKTSNYIKSVDTMADFLKSFEDPGRLKGADMTMSLQMSHSGGDKFNTDKNFDPTDNTNKQISSSTFEDMLDDKVKNLTLDVNKTLQTMENKLNSKTELNNNAMAVLNETIQSNYADTLNQTHHLNLELTEMKSKLKNLVVEKNNTLSLVTGLNNTLLEIMDIYLDNPWALKFTKQCTKNDISSLPEQMIVILNGSKLALCDTKTDGGGWIVIQRRVKGDVSFIRNWNDYKNGFGSLAGDYWLGNDWISNLTRNGYSELRFDMKYKGKSYYAVYSNVTVGNEADLYRIKFTYKTGNVTDKFDYQQGAAFSTYDRDNESDSRNCAEVYKGGWWYVNHCHEVKLNGVWASKEYADGIIWSSLTTQSDSLDQVEMKLSQP